MVADENEKRVDEAQAVFERAASRKAKKADWGVYSYGDAPPAAGGGVGLFTWFADRKAMLHAVVDYLPYFSPGPSTADPATVATATAKAVKGMGRSAPGLEAGRKAVNTALKRFSVITWWGTFESLLQGTGSFEKEIRSQFRSAGGTETSAKPTDRSIAPKELSAFREYLQSYGM